MKQSLFSVFLASVLLAGCMTPPLSEAQEPKGRPYESVNQPATPAQPVSHSGYAEGGGL